MISDGTIFEKLLGGELNGACGITANSQEVESGWIFVAVKGVRSDGHDYIEAAYQAGAKAVVGERSEESVSSGGKYIRVPDSASALAWLADRHFGSPSRFMKVFGVTGTSGKTTTTYLLESILKVAGHRVGLIGTVELRCPAWTRASTHTTPGPVEIQKILHEMKSAGCTAVVMEVSSHALKQKRTDWIAFDGVIFTNLTAEHLDYHPDMEDYFLAKSRLFLDYRVFAQHARKRLIATVNEASSWGQRLVREMKTKGSPVGTVQSFPSGFSGDIQGVRGALEGVAIQSPLVGEFNAENVAGAVGCARGAGISPGEIAEGVAKLTAVPGRMERVESSTGIHVFVDYAHKPDALEKVLHALRESQAQGQRLITVFGCGGDRDRTKRPVMGEVAARLSDRVIVTSDNPRTENPLRIIDEILAGIPKSNTVEVEADRAKAIKRGILHASVGDVVLIAGKGHEDYQILLDEREPTKTRKIHFDDRQVAREILARLGGHSN